MRLDASEAGRSLLRRLKVEMALAMDGEVSVGGGSFVRCARTSDAARHGSTVAVAKVVMKPARPSAVWRPAAYLTVEEYDQAAEWMDMDMQSVKKGGNSGQYGVVQRLHLLLPTPALPSLMASVLAVIFFHPSYCISLISVSFSGEKTRSYCCLAQTFGFSF